MKLPETWAEFPLARVAEDMQPGFAQAPGDEEAGTIPQIRTHNVSPEGRLTLDGIKHVTPSQMELEKYSLVPGDIVFNNTNSEEWVGKTAVFRDAGQYVFSNHMTRIRARAEVAEPDYLGRYLHFLWTSGYSRNRAKRWVSQAAVDSPTLAKFKILLPTLPEQQRIVAVLRQAEEIERFRETQTCNISALARERFYDLFGHPAINVRGFELVPIFSLGDFDRGVSKHRPRDAAHLLNGPYPFIQTGDVTNAGDWITEYSKTYSEAGLAQSRLWPKGTLCITIAANIARAAILDFDACFPDSVVGFTPYPGVHTEYVLYCLRFYQEYFEQRAPKAAQMNINLEKLRALRVPKPPEPLQKEFAKFVHAVRDVNDALRSQHRATLSLRLQLQLAAFSGELSEEWRAAHRRELEEADAERRGALRKGAERISVTITEHARVERKIVQSIPARAWLVEQLSEFQRNVWLAMREWNGSVAPEDAEGFADFCSNPGTAWSIEHEGASPDRIKRTLEQLAALGLIAKVLIPNANGKYMTAFRPLREGEDTRLVDASRLETLLRQETEQS